MMKRRLVLLSMLALPGLAACGDVQTLQPAAGASYPPAAYGAERQASAEELIEPSAQARPERSVEVIRRSEERAEDPFDLPPD